MTSPSTSMSPTASTTAGQAGDDDVEETSDSSDDGYNNRISIMFWKKKEDREFANLVRRRQFH
jgi:hypothetical protein